MLLLGCGDARSVFPTLAELQARGAARVHIHLSDISDAILARAVLLLTLAESLDPSSQEDLEYFYAVWYCSQLSRAQRLRLDELLRRLAAGRCAWRHALAVQKHHGKYWSSAVCSLCSPASHSFG